MQDGEPKTTLSSETRASNPGRIALQPLRWLRHYPKWPVLWLLLFIVCVELSVRLHALIGLGALLGLALNVFYWRRLREHFFYGCTNPSIVVSVSPLRIAVATDLSKGIGRYPAIKVIEKSLSDIHGAKPEVGMRLATVALYHEDLDDTEQQLPHWGDFDPRPAQCATGDEDALRRVLGSIDDADWADLDEWYVMAGRPTAVGLYKVWESWSWRQQYGETDTTDGHWAW